MTRKGAAFVSAGLLVAGHALVQGCSSGCEAPNDGSHFCEDLENRLPGGCTDTDECVTYYCEGGGSDQCGIGVETAFRRAPVDALRSLHGELCSGGLGSGVLECGSSGFDPDIIIWCKPADPCAE